MGINVSVSDQAGQLWQRGLEGLGEGFAKGIQQGREHRMQLDFMEGRIGALAEEHPDLITPELLDKFQTSGLGQKQGMLVGLEAQAEQRRSQQRMQMAAQMNEASAIAAQERRAVYEEEQRAKAQGQAWADVEGLSAQMWRSKKITDEQAATVGSFYPFADLAVDKLDQFLQENEKAKPATVDPNNRFLQQVLPDGSVIVLDQKTGEPVPNSQIRAPESATKGSAPSILGEILGEGAKPSGGAPAAKAQGQRSTVGDLFDYMENVQLP